jgi:carboxymethylenebutenolidase
VLRPLGPAAPPPITGGAPIAGSDLVLGADDGNRFAAFAALATEPGAPGIVILPDVRGYTPSTGISPSASPRPGPRDGLRLFARTAGEHAKGRGEDFDFTFHRAQTTPQAIALDVAAAVAHVRSPAGGGAARAFTVGLCFGGRHSFNQAARGLDLAGVIGFYGVPQPIEDDDANTPVVLARAYECPVLALFGGADRSISRHDIERFREALDEVGVPSEIVVYDGAPHSFFDRSFEQHRNASDDVWRRVLAFVGRRIASAEGS